MSNDDRKIIVQRCGVLLYGERWKTPLARDLGYTDANVINGWLAAKGSPSYRTVPPAVIDRLRTHLEDRHYGLTRMINTIDRYNAINSYNEKV